MYCPACLKKDSRNRREIIKVISLQEPNIHLYSTKKRQHFSHTERLFLSDTHQGMKHWIATQRLSKMYIARCGYTWLDESNWPQEWPISPITMIYFKIPSEKMKFFCLHKTVF